MPWMSNIDTHPDPARLACGNYGCPAGEWENHTSKRCQDCHVEHRLCDPDYGAGDICEEHMADNIFRSESDEDRRAAYRTALGI